MKSGFIKVLIGSITIAMVGLIGIQFYWINNAFNLREDEFNRQVSDALEHVSIRLERQEAQQKLLDNFAGNLLYRSIDTLVQQTTLGPDSARPDYFFVKDIRQDGDEIEVKVIEEKDGKRRTKVVRSEPFAPEGVQHGEVSWQGEVAIAPQTVVDSTYDYEDDEDWSQNAQQRQHFVSEMVKSLMHVHIFDRLEDRIDSSEMDSMLAEAFAASGVSTAFHFGVYNENNQLVAGRTGEFETELTESLFKAHLFPNDVVDHHVMLRVFFPDQRKYLVGTLGWMLAISALLILAVIFGFSFTITTIIRQKKLSEIKNDFINNMTHELKTPISTISLACQAMSDPDINSNNNLVGRYVNMIGDENKRLGSLVERVLQSAVLDKGDFKVRSKAVQLNDLVSAAADKIDMQVRERNGELHLALDQELPTVKADPEHLTNVIYNLLDNAIKYSPNQLDVTVSTRAMNGKVALTVADKGIGIKGENIKRVFEKLYRVPTGDVHDVKGFGLGLNYVKTIVEKHGGTVQADSKFGIGSSFTITLPTQAA